MERPQNATYVLTTEDGEVMHPMIVGKAVQDFKAVQYEDAGIMRFHVNGLENAYGLRSALTMSSLEDVNVTMEVMQ